MHPISKDYLAEIISELEDTESHFETPSVLLNQLIERLREGRYQIIDTRPACMYTQGMVTCTHYGQYQPRILLIDVRGEPIMQLDTQPPIRLCAEHATLTLDVLMPPGEHRLSLSESVLRNQQRVIDWQRSQVLYIDCDSGLVVTAPSPAIASN